MTRFVSLLLAVLMLLTACPFVAAADGGFVLSVVNFDADLAADAAENLERMLPYAEEAMQSGASLVLFPENSLCATKQTAVSPDDAAILSLSSLAERKGRYLLFGAVIEEADGQCYPSLVVCGPGGGVEYYRKQHLSDTQYANGLSAGDAPFVLQTSFGRFGLCMGDEFARIAELGKYYLGKGCQMILSAESAGAPTGDAAAAGAIAYERYAAAYAYHYLYYRGSASANLFTKSDGVSYIGQSYVCQSYASGFVSDGGSGRAPTETAAPGVVTAYVQLGAVYNGMASKWLHYTADWYHTLQDTPRPDYSETGPYRDEVRVASVNFHPVWGDVEQNTQTILSMMENAHADGIELLVFPELALTGYSVGAMDGQYMQKVMAQTIRGEHPSEAVQKIQAAAEQYGMYVLVGMPERDEQNPDKCWNSVAILGPGLRQSYRKINVVMPETLWAYAASSNQDAMFETPFGWVGLAICADIYHFQEIQRTLASHGCRIVVNCTAGAGNMTNTVSGGWQMQYATRLQHFALRDGNAMLSSNLVGYDGPALSESLQRRLAEEGYTADAITSAWLVDGAYTSLVYARVENLPVDDDDAAQSQSSGFKSVSRLPGVSHIFPGGSVCIAPDASSPFGLTVSGNTGESAVYRSEKLGAYAEKAGLSAYMSYTADTFNAVYAADLDLSGADARFTSNPTVWRPELYAAWYAEMYADIGGWYHSERTLTSGDWSLSGRLLPNATLSVTAVQEAASAGESDPLRHITWTLDFASAYKALDYSGQCLPFTGKVTVSLPAQGLLPVLLVNGEPVEAQNGTFTFTLTDDDAVIEGYARIPRSGSAIGRYER